MSFSDKVDAGYRKHRNPYHNPNHAADVAQTTHFFICQTGENTVEINEEFELFLLWNGEEIRVCSSIDICKWLKLISGSKLAKNIITQACVISSAFCRVCKCDLHLQTSIISFACDFEINACFYRSTQLVKRGWSLCHDLCRCNSRLRTYRDNEHIPHANQVCLGWSLSLPVVKRLPMIRTVS